MDFASHRPKILVALVALALGLALTEAGLRLVIGLRPPDPIPVPLRPDLYESWDPHGYRLKPSRMRPDRYPHDAPGTVTVTSNRHGFRGRRELDEPDTRPRIVVLGDSFTFGLGVEEAERFTEVLESLEAEWRVDNLGMPGFGGDLMLRSLETVGIGLEPDIVLLCLYTDDFRRVHPRWAGLGFATPRFVLRGGELATIDFPRRTPWSRSSIGWLLENGWWRVGGAERDLNAAILDRFRTLSARHGFAFTIAFFPGRTDAPQDRERRFWLQRYAHDTATPYHDLTDAIHGERADVVFLPRNWHWSAGGHRVAANELRRFLRSVFEAGPGPTS